MEEGIEQEDSELFNAGESDDLISDHSPFVAGSGGGGLEVVLYSVDEDIVPRQFRRMYATPSEYVVSGPLLQIGDWSERVRNTSGMLITYVIPVLMTSFIVGALLTGSPLRRMYATVLSTSFYVFASLLVDSCVLIIQCGTEWLRAAAGVDIRTMITSSSAVLCKIYPFATSFVIELSSWLTVLMAAETAWIYQRPQRLMSVARLQRARRVLSVLFVLIGLANCHLFWTHTIHYPTSSSASAHSTSYDQPICVDRLTDPRWVEAGNGAAASSWGRDVARLIVAGGRFTVAQLVPYFAVFSCAVMLLTKRWRRRDQLRQVDNTWKACNIDASAGRQLHTAFALLCVVHSVALLPRLAFDSFQLVTDPKFTGHRSVSYRPASVLAKAIVYLLHYTFLAVRPLILVGVSSALRRQCAEDACFATIAGSRLCVCCCVCLRRKSSSSNHVHRHHSSSSLSVDGGSAVGTGSGLATSGVGSANDYGTSVVGEPLLQKSVVENNHHGHHHVTFNEVAKTDDIMGGTILTPLPPPPPPQCSPAAAAAIVLENGAPCIKIFSMTSV